MALHALLEGLTATDVQGAALAIDAARTADADAALLAAHGLVERGLLITPFEVQVAAVARARGVFCAVRQERHALPPAADWIPPGHGAADFAVRLDGGKVVGSELWLTPSDAPVGTFDATHTDLWLGPALMRALAGFASWPGQSEWDLLHVRRLAESLVLLQRYWLAELGNAYCPSHSALDGDHPGAFPCPSCARVRVLGRRPAERRERIAGPAGLQIADNALAFLRFEAECFRLGTEEQRLDVPELLPFDLGAACDYARVHQRRLRAPSTARWLEHCMRPDVDYAASAPAFAARCAELLGALLAPAPPADPAPARRAATVLRDVGARLCHAAALHGRPTDGFQRGLTAVADALARLDVSPADADPGAVDALLGAALDAVCADLAAVDGPPGAAEVLALGYRPTHAGAAEPAPCRAARKAAAVARAYRTSHLHGVVLEGFPEALDALVDLPRAALLEHDLQEAAKAAEATHQLSHPPTSNFMHLVAGWLSYPTDLWGPPASEQRADPLASPLRLADYWRLRLSCPTLPDAARAGDYRVVRNRYLKAIPFPFRDDWLDKALAQAAGQVEPLKPKMTMNPPHVMVGAGRRGPRVVPLVGVRRRIWARAEEELTVADFLARGKVSAAELQQAVDDDLVLLLDFKRDPAAAAAAAASAPATAAAPAATPPRPEPPPPEPLAAAPPPADEPPPLGAWGELEQAESYERFTARSTLYRDTSTALVAALGVAPGERVADLGCGVGVSSRVALERLGPAGALVAVDPSPVMLERARRNVVADNARVVQGDARVLPGIAREAGAFDACLCNSALWLDRDVPGALRAVRAALREGGRFGLTVPAEIAGHDVHSRKAEMQALGEAVAAVRNESPATAPQAVLVDFDPDQLGSLAKIVSLLTGAGFAEIEAKLFQWYWRLDDYVEWMSMPAVRQNVRPDLDGATFARKVRERVTLPPDTAVEGRWYIIVAR